MNLQRASEPTESIRRNYLHDEVAERLRALIQSGEMRPREKLNESALAKRFGISRTPLREAIKILSSEGLLELLPNRGAQVACISQQEIENAIEVIAALERVAGELLCQNATDEELAAIEALHEEMAIAYREGDAPRYFELNEKIHKALMASSHNAVLEGVYTSLSSRVQRARFAAHKTPEQWTRAMNDHHRMIELMRERNGEELGKLLRAHVYSKKQVISAMFGNEDA